METHGCSKSNTRILYVEDNADNQRLISLFLGMKGYEVKIASNGLEGNDMAMRAWHHDEPFDVILMDMQMPVMDGYEATRRLRDVGYPFPIIAFTAHSLVGDREQCLEAGCNAYLSKPLEREKMLSTLTDMLNRGPFQTSKRA